MEIEVALRFIKENWSKLPKETIENIEAVWFVDNDISADYEVDIEKVGMKQDGSLIWAYASGCSCWDGYYATKPVPDIKVFEFNHSDLKEKWQEVLIKFVKENENV